MTQLALKAAGQPHDGWSESGWQAVEVADLTAQVAAVLRQRIDEKELGSIYRDVELPLAPLLYRMERAGMRIDTEVLAELSGRLGEQLESLTDRICQMAGREFNIGSPKQVGEVLRSYEHHFRPQDIDRSCLNQQSRARRAGAHV